jgi:hypothetical protein
MPSLKVTLNIEEDGVKVKGFPITEVVSVDESQMFDATRATGGGFVALPTGELDSISVLFVRSDVAATLRLDGQSDAGIVLAAGGYALVVGGTIDAGAATNATFSNASGGDAQVKGIAGGS